MNRKAAMIALGMLLVTAAAAQASDGGDGTPAPRLAQLPGEPKAPPAYDPAGDAKYRFQLWTPDERVREAQRALRDSGYYQGPLDGLMSPEMRRAVWNFQKARGFRLSGRLDSRTIAALGLGSTGTASQEAPASFGPQPSALPSWGSESGPARSAPAPTDSQAP